MAAPPTDVVEQAIAQLVAAVDFAAIVSQYDGGVFDVAAYEAAMAGPRDDYAARLAAVGVSNVTWEVRGAGSGDARWFLNLHESLLSRERSVRR